MRSTGDGSPVDIQMKLIPFFIGLITVALAGSVSADGIPSPTRIFIDTPGQSAPLTITNTAVEARRFTLAVWQWRQGDDGVPELSPTDAISLSDETLWIEGGGQVTVEVRSSAALSPGEHPFRISIRPSDDAAPSGRSAAVVRVIDLPVFVGTPLDPADLHLVGVNMHDGVVSAVLANRGGGSVRPQTVEVIGFDASRRELTRQSWEGWHILSKGRRRYELSVDADKCAAIDHFRLDVRMMDGERRTATIPWILRRARTSLRRVSAYREEWRCVAALRHDPDLTRSSAEFHPPGVRSRCRS